MKKLPRFATLALVGITLFSLAGSVTFAWLDADYTSFPQASCPAGNNFFAQNNDVVTTDKWNGAMCYLRGLFTVLF